MHASVRYRSFFSLVGVCAAIASPAARSEPPPGSTFALTGRLDTDAAVTVDVVAAKGAIVTATGRDGTAYRLTIPPNALPLNAAVTVTPLTALGGVPGQTAHYGADLAPTGTQLLELATLEIVPKTPLPTTVYWFEHTGAPDRLAAQLAFPLNKARAMSVSHFSGGSVVVAPIDFDADPGSHQRAPWVFSASDSIQTLQIDRNIVEHLYQQERIDQKTHDANLEAIDRLLQKAANDDVVDQLAQAQEHERERAGETEEIAARGRLEDLDVLSARLKTAIDAERQAELAGFPATFDPLEPIATYVAALVGHCPAQPVPAARMVGLAHQAALVGYEVSSQDISRCVCVGPDQPSELCPADAWDAASPWAGTICDLAKPFEIRYPSGSPVSLSFTPSTPSSGAVSMRWTFSDGVTASGDGHYQFAQAGTDAATITLDLPYVVHTPSGDFQHNDNPPMSLARSKPGACPR